MATGGNNDGGPYYDPSVPIPIADDPTYDPNSGPVNFALAPVNRTFTMSPWLQAQLNNNLGLSPMQPYQYWWSQQGPEQNYNRTLQLNKYYPNAYASAISPVSQMSGSNLGFGIRFGSPTPNMGGTTPPPGGGTTPPPGGGTTPPPGGGTTTPPPGGTGTQKPYVPPAIGTPPTTPIVYINGEPFRNDNNYRTNPPVNTLEQPGGQYVPTGSTQTSTGTWVDGNGNIVAVPPGKRPADALTTPDIPVPSVDNNYNWTPANFVNPDGMTTSVVQPNISAADGRAIQDSFTDKWLNSGTGGAAAGLPTAQWPDPNAATTATKVLDPTASSTNTSLGLTGSTNYENQPTSLAYPNISSAEARNIQDTFTNNWLNSGTGVAYGSYPPTGAAAAAAADPNYYVDHGVTNRALTPTNPSTYWSNQVGAWVYKGADGLEYLAFV